METRLIYGTSKGNENWFQKSIVRESEGKITVFNWIHVEGNPRAFGLSY